VGINLKLHLGVNQVPEFGNSNWDTYDVAKHLEETYGLYSAFAEYEGQKMADYLADSVAGAIEQLDRGSEVEDPFSNGAGKITKDFKKFISEQTAEKVLTPGSDKRPVPTKAALVGASRRLGKRTGVRRASFIDSSTFVDNITTWVEE
jgi:hypothetical protein